MNKTILTLICSISFISTAFSANYYHAGKTEYEKSNYQQANLLFQKAIEQTPDNLKYRYYYAQSLIQIYKLEKAQQEYQKIIELAPNSEEARLSLLGIYKLQSFIKKRNNYASSSSPKKPLSITSTGDNYIDNTHSNGLVTRWNTKKMPLKIYIEQASSANGHKQYYFSETKRAINSWMSNINSNLLSYKLVNSTNNADIKIHFLTELLKQTAKEYVAGLATANSEGNILKSYDIQIKSTKPDGSSFSKNEIYTTALHERGHAFGIKGHSPKKTDIMYAAVETNSSNLVTKLSRRDINTLNLLYQLNADISNFDPNEIKEINTTKNNTVLGTKEERLEKKLKEALNYAKKHPENVLSWTQLGQAYFDREHYNKAITSYQKALKINPEFSNAREGLGFAYKSTNKFDKAVKEFSYLAEQNPQNLSYSYNLALYLAQNKDNNKAKQVLDTLIKANPEAIKNQNIKTLFNDINK